MRQKKEKRKHFSLCFLSPRSLSLKITLLSFSQNSSLSLSLSQLWEKQFRCLGRVSKGGGGQVSFISFCEGIGGQVFLLLVGASFSLVFFSSLSLSPYAPPPLSRPPDGSARRRDLRRRRRRRRRRTLLLGLHVDVSVGIGRRPRRRHRHAQHLEGAPRHRPGVVGLDHRHDRRVAVRA